MKDKFRKKRDRRKQLAKKDENEVMGTCVDCGQPCLLSDIFIVKNATWAEAGLDGWNAGHLHLSCFKKRLGRDLKEGELLVWNIGGQKFKAHPDYLNSPEYREHR